MKNTIYTLLIGLMLAITVSAFSQDPPPPSPNDGLNPVSNGNKAVGSSAPIADGLGILLALGAAYGIKKVYQFNKKENDSSHNF